MILDELLEDVLEHYNKVWRAGCIKAYINIIEKHLNAFLETLTESQRMKGVIHLGILSCDFCEKNAPVSAASFDKHIERYKSERCVKYSTRKK